MSASNGYPQVHSTVSQSQAIQQGRMQAASSCAKALGVAVACWGQKQGILRCMLQPCSDWTKFDVKVTAQQSLVALPWCLTIWAPLSARGTACHQVEPTAIHTRTLQDKLQRKADYSRQYQQAYIMHAVSPQPAAHRHLKVHVYWTERGSPANTHRTPQRQVTGRACNSARVCHALWT